MNFYAYLFVFSVFHKTRQKCKRLLQWNWVFGFSLLFIIFVISFDVN